MSVWLDSSGNSNKFKQSYFRDFVDVSGEVLIRNGLSLKLYNSNIPTRVQFSINSNEFRVYNDADHTYYDISNTKLMHLQDLSENIQAKLNQVNALQSALSLKANASDVDASLKLKSNITYVDASLNAKPSFSQVDSSLNLKSSLTYVDASLNLKSSLTYVDASLNMKSSLTYVDASLNAKPSFSQVDASLNLKSNLTYVDASLNAKPSFSQVDASLNLKSAVTYVDASLNLKSAVTYVDASLNLKSAVTYVDASLNAKPSFSQVDASLNLKSAITYVDASLNAKPSFSQVDSSLNLKANLASPTLTGTPNAPTASYDNSSNQIATTGFVQGRISSIINSAPAALDTLNELAAALGNDANFAATVTNSLSQKANTTDVNTALALKATISSVDASLNMKSNLTYVDASLNAKPSFSQVDVSLNLKSAVTYVDASLNLKSNITYVDASLNAKPSFSQVDASLNLKSAVTYVDASLNLKSAVTYVDASLNLKPSFSQVDASLNLKANLASPTLTGTPNAPTASYDNSSNQIATTGFVQGRISSIINSAPAALDTLNELATALGNDANFAATVTNSLSQKANTTDVNSALALKATISSVDASLNMKSNLTYVDASLNAKPSFSQVDASLNAKPSFSQIDASLNLKSAVTYVDASLNLKSAVTYVDASLNAKPSFSQVDASLNLKSAITYVDASLNAKPSFSQVDASLNLKSAITYVDASLNAKPSFSQVDSSLNLKANLASPTFTGTPNAPTASYDNSSNQIATTGFVQGRISSIINSAPAALDTLNELAAALGNDANFAATVTNSLSQKANTADVNTALALKATISSVDASLNLKSNVTYVDASLNAKPSFSQVDVSLNAKPSFSQIDASLNLKSAVTYVDASLNLKSAVTYVDASLNAKPSFSQVDASLNAKPSFSQVDASLNLKSAVTYVDASLNLKAAVAYVDASLNAKPSFSQVDVSLNTKPSFSQVDASLNLKASSASPTFTGTLTAPKLISGDASFNGNIDISGVLSVTQTVNSVVKNTTINNYNVSVTNDLSLNGKLIVSSDVSLNSKLYVKSDASFNGRVDVCGNFYAQYPNNSIPSSAINNGVTLSYVDSSLNAKPSFAQVDASLNLKSSVTYVDASLNLKSAVTYVDASLNAKPSFSQVDASLNMKPSFSQVDASLNAKPSFSQVDASLNLKPSFSQIDASLNLKSAVTYVDASLNLKPSFAQVDVSLNAKPSFSQVDASLNLKPSFSQVDVSLNLKPSFSQVDVSLNLKPSFSQVDASLNLKPSFSQVDASLNLKSAVTYVDASLNLKANLASPTFTGTPNAPTASYDNSSNQIATTGFVQGRISSIINSAPAALDTLNELAAALGNDANFAATVTNSLSQKANTTDVNTALALKATISSVDASLNLKPSFSQVDASLNLKPSFSQVDASLNLKSAVTYVDASLNLKPSFSQVDASLNLKPSFAQVDASLNMKSAVTYVDASLNLKPSFSQVDASLNMKPSFSQVDASLNLKANIASPTFTGTPNAPTALYDNSSNQIATTGFVQGRISSIINSAPAALDTLNELAAALGNDANFAATVTNSLSQKANTTDVNSALALKPSFSQVDVSLNLKSAVTYVDASLNLKPSFSQVDVSLNLKPSFSQVDASLNLKSSVTYVDASLNLKPSFSQVDTSLNLKPSFSQVDASLNLKPTFAQVDASLNAIVNMSQVDASLNLKPSFSQVDASLNLKPTFTQVDASLNLKSSVTYVDASLNLKANLASPTFTGTPNAPTASYDNSSNQIATTGFVQGRISSIINSAPAALDTLNELAAALGNDANFAATVTNSLSQKANTTDVNSALALKPSFAQVDASLNMKPTSAQVDASLNLKPSFVQVDASLNLKPSFSQVDASLNLKSAVTYVDASLNLKPSFVQVDASLNLKPTFAQVDASLNAIVNMSQVDASLNLKSNLTYVDASLNLKSNLTYVDASLNLKSNLTYVDASLNLKPRFAQVDASLNLKPNFSQVDASLNLKPSFSQVDASLNLKANLASPTFTGIVTAAKLTSGDASFNGNIDISGVLSVTQTVNSVVKNTTINNYNVAVTNDLSLNGKLIVSSDVSLNSKLYVKGDASFNGRVDICGNFYANYPANSIPSSAIIGGVSTGSVDISSNQTISGVKTFTNGLNVGNTLVSSVAAAVTFDPSFQRVKIGQDIDGEAADDQSGFAVSLSADGTIVAIGARFNDGTASNAGQVRVYKNINGTWTKLGQDIDGEATPDQSGYSVSLSADGTIVAIGAIYNDGGGADSGHVRVYQYNGSTTWTQLGQDINGEATTDWSGYSVSLSSDGTIVAIGSWYNNGVNGSDSGHVRIYKYDGSTTWTKLGQDIDGEAANDQSGFSVSLSSNGQIVAIGARYNAGTVAASYRGQVRVYQYNGTTTWTQIGQDIDGEASQDNSGWSVSLSSDGTIVAIGAVNNDGTTGTSTDNRGSIRVYKNISGTWTQLGQDIDGEAAGDLSGFSISLNGDGTIVAIGAYLNDGTGSNAGHVRIYQYISNAWQQLGSDIDGEAAGDQSGYSVSLSSDGTMLAVGANQNDGANGVDSGHVRVYQIRSAIASSTKLTIGNNVDICGNFYAQYAAASIPASAINGISTAIQTAIDLKATKTIVDASFTSVNSAIDLKATKTIVDASFTSVNSAIDLKATKTIVDASFTSVNSAIDLKATKTIVDASFTSVNSAIALKATKTIVDASFTSVNSAIALKADLANPTFTGTVTASKVVISSDASFNGRVDICGNFYAQYPASSIPSSAIIGGVGGGSTSGVDISSNQTISGVKTFTNGLNVGPILVSSVTGNPSFQRIQIGQDIDGEAASDQFGWSVSTNNDGTVVAIGAPYNGSLAGHVRIYKYNGSTWTQLGQDIDGDATNDRRGYSVSLSSDGTIVAVGAINNSGSFTRSGRVTVYKYNGSTTWTQIGQSINGEAGYDNAGWSVSLSSDGTIVAVGAANNDGTTGTLSDNRGRVRIYKYNGSTTWTQLGQNIDGEATTDQSGYSVSLSSDGTIVAIGAPYNDGTSGIDRGSVRVYQYNGSTTWTQLGQDIDGEAASDNFGWSVSLSSDGTIVAIGAINNDGTSGIDRGSVRVYKYNGSTWAQLGQDIDGEGVSNEFGNSVSLSTDGTILAIGGPTNTSGAGHARIYQYSGTTWTQLGSDIDSEGNSDRFGYSVSLSKDGTIVAIGAFFNDGVNGVDSGHVRVYKIRDLTTTKVIVSNNLDICGNLYAQYAAASIPASAINGISTAIQTAIDLKATKTIVDASFTSVNSAIALKATQSIVDASFTSVNSAIALKANLASPTFTGNVVASKMRVTSDASFNGRVDICGNFYAQYPASSIPSSAIIGGVGGGGGGGGSSATDISINSLTVGRGSGNNSSNTAFGVNALFAQGVDVNSNSTAIGYYALSANQAGSAVNNSAVGFEALKNNTIGNFNTALGSAALRNNTSGGSNTALGTSSLTSNTTGNSNVGINGGLSANTSGSDNIAIGKQTLTASQTGGNNIGIGTLVLQGITSSSNNTAVGHRALVYSSSGNSNTAFGYLAGQNNSSGSFNTYIGYGTDLPSYGATWSNSTAIGANAMITASNQITLGTASERVFMPGKLTTSGDASFNGRVDISGNLYANYPAGSIPSSAITGGVLDLTSSQTISGTKTFSTQLNIGTNAITQLATLAVAQIGTNLLGRANAMLVGTSTALNDAGTIVAVGCPADGNFIGSVRIYQWSGTAWTQLGQDIVGTADNTQFGNAVSLSSTGFTIAIGGFARNLVRVYQYASNTWTKIGADIVGTGGAGSSVSISADGLTVAIGAPNAYINGGQDTGQTRVYKYISSAWTQLGQDLIGEAASNRSGFSLALSADGTIVVIGAHYNDGTNPNTTIRYMSGHARIYKYANSTWTQLGQDIDGEVSYDMSGWSVAISDDGTIVAIGAPRNTTGATTYNGHARIYKYANSTWTQLGQDIDGRAIWAQSGSKISLSADGYTVAIGSESANGLGGEASRGYAVVYKYNGSTWSIVGSYIEGQAAQDQFGYSISLSADGTILSVGAPYNNSNVGYVKVYKVQTPSSKIIVSDGLDICGNLYAKQLQLSSSATFNGRVDICGNFYAQYPPNSIPASAIIGGVGSSSGSSGSSTGANVTFTDNFALIKEAVVVDPASILLRQF